MSVALDQAATSDATPAVSTLRREFRDPRSGVSLGVRSPSNAPADAIPLPEPGEKVALGRGPEMAQGYWIGVVEPANGPEVTVRLLRDGKVEEHVAHLGALHAPRIVTSRGEPEVSEALRALAGICKMSDIARCESQARLDALVAAAHDYAEDASLCERFDEFMHSQGLPAREGSYTVRIDVRGIVSLAVSARSPGEAENAVTPDLVRDNVDSLEQIRLQVESATRD